MMPVATQGWRPTSVVIHPAMTAMKPSGQDSAAALMKGGFRKACRAPRGCRRKASQDDKPKPDRDHDPEAEKGTPYRRPVLRLEFVQPLDKARSSCG